MYSALQAALPCPDTKPHSTATSITVVWYIRSGGHTHTHENITIIDMAMAMMSMYQPMPMQMTLLNHISHHILQNEY
jgi:hypothetical protein